jgi:kynurenine formamidase
MEFPAWQVIDLTHPLSEDMPVWPGDPATRIEQAASIALYGYALNRLAIGEHSGTHVGVPGHFYTGGRDVSQIPASELIVPGIKINISEQAAHNPDLMLQSEHLLEWEKSNGPIRPRSFILIESGWSQFYHQPEAYLGLRDSQMHFPGVSQSAAEMLIEQYQARGIGIDTAGIDGGLSADFAANKSLAEHDALHLENLTNLGALPAMDFLLFIGALPIKNGSGSPCRVIALLL